MAIGDIGAVIDSLEFDPADCQFPKIIHISGNVYAVAHQGTSAQGWIRTMSIDLDGDIGASVIDSFQYSSTNGEFPDICHVFGDVYAIVYTRNVSTITIDSDGNIGASLIDTLQLDWPNFTCGNIKHIYGDIYAIAYAGTSVVGIIKTVDIANNGTIDNSIVDTFTFDAGRGNYPVLIHIHGNVYAIVYTGPDNDGWLCTLSIDNFGNISASVIDSLEFDAGEGNRPDICHVSGDVYVISYTNAGYDGKLITVDISASGVIDNSIIDTFTLPGTWGMHTKIINPSGDLFAIAYCDVGNDGWVSSITISAAGDIAASCIDSLEFDAVQGAMPDILHLSGDIYASPFRGPDNDGWLKSFNIETPAEAAAKHFLMMGIG